MIAELIEKNLNLKITGQQQTTSKGQLATFVLKTDIDQAEAVGRHAVELALKGKTSVMTTIERITNQPYTWGLGSIDLKKLQTVKKCYQPITFQLTGSE